MNSSLFSLNTTNNADISAGVEWKIQSERHVIVVHRGGLMHKLETELNGVGKSYGPAVAGELWFVPAASSYHARSLGKTINYSTLEIDPKIVPDKFQNLSPFADIASFHGHQDLFSLQMVNSINHYCQFEDDISQMILTSLQETLYLHLYDKYYLKKTNSLNSANNTTLLSANDIKLLRKYIHTNLSGIITLENLASSFGLSTHQFLMAFRVSFDTTPAQYIIQARIRKVKWFLNHSNMNITTIAYETGFSSHSHLTTTFKQHVGYSPSEYRKLSV